MAYLDDKLNKYQEENSEQHKQIMATNAKQQEAIDRICRILDGDELGKGIKDMIKEMYDNYKGMAWIGKSILRVFIVLGIIVSAIIGVFELIKRFYLKIL